MKLLLSLICFVVAGLAAAYAVEPIVIKSALPAKTLPLKPKLPPVRTYHDVLSVIPQDMEPGNASRWGQSEKDVANIILKKKLTDVGRAVSMKVRVSEVSDWGRMIVWATLENDEGYAIRVFAGADNPAFLPQLATLKQGDFILLEGSLEKVLFEQLWGSPALSICVKEGKVTKLLPNGLPAPRPASINLTVVSAVYGSGINFADVTERVKGMLKEPGSEFAATPHWLGADPTPGRNKALVVVYLVGVQRHVFTVGEGGEISAARMVKPAE